MAAQSRRTSAASVFHDKESRIWTGSATSRRLRKLKVGTLQGVEMIEMCTVLVLFVIFAAI